jgi:cell wall-associated NlpC family hydrolase
MVKRLIATGLVTLAITFSSTPMSAKAIEIQEVTPNKTVLIQNTQVLFDNTQTVKLAVKKLNKTVGKTWYVFSGATPSGWDCSGLTMWFYQQIGIQLEHRASKQQSAGFATKNPKVGDLVVFKYKGYKSAYHVGIYIGSGKMIHAPKHGHATSIQSVKQFAGDYSNVSYRTMIETI